MTKKKEVEEEAKKDSEQERHLVTNSMTTNYSRQERQQKEGVAPSSGISFSGSDYPGKNGSTGVEDDKEQEALSLSLVTRWQASFEADPPATIHSSSSNARKRRKLESRSSASIFGGPPLADAKAASTLVFGGPPLADAKAASTRDLADASSDPLTSSSTVTKNFCAANRSIIVPAPIVSGCSLFLSRGTELPECLQEQAARIVVGASPSACSEPLVLVPLPSVASSSNQALVTSLIGEVRGERRLEYIRGPGGGIRKLRGARLEPHQVRL
ncbi:unnamed protein product [Amoebophrya sp. A25]|nr:unnamed protein product [Amoebophrya sp. A25]|eukprot:GSA25T00019143001.1